MALVDYFFTGLLAGFAVVNSSLQVILCLIRYMDASCSMRDLSNEQGCYLDRHAL